MRYLYILHVILNLSSLIIFLLAISWYTNLYSNQSHRPFMTFSYYLKNRNHQQPATFMEDRYTYWRNTHLKLFNVTELKHQSFHSLTEQECLHFLLQTKMLMHNKSIVTVPRANVTVKNIFILFLVLSHPGNTERRNLIRSTWGAKYKDPNQNHTIKLMVNDGSGRIIFIRYKVDFVFIIGESEDATMQHPINSTVTSQFDHDRRSGLQNVSLRTKVLLESQNNKDMVQFNFLDTYRNLTYKILAGLFYAYELVFTLKSTLDLFDHKFILKIDDDTIPNIRNLWKLCTKPEGFFRREESSKNIYEGEVLVPPYIRCKIGRHQKPIREPGHKNYLSLKEYPNETFPILCKGGFYAVSFGDPKILKEIVDGANTIPYIPNEDVFVTGLLANDKIGIPLVNLDFGQYVPDYEMFGKYKNNPVHAMVQINDPGLYKYLWEEIDDDKNIN